MEYQAAVMFAGITGEKIIQDSKSPNLWDDER
jgi:hypothetical protein